MDPVCLCGSDVVFSVSTEASMVGCVCSHTFACKFA